MSKKNKKKVEERFDTDGKYSTPEQFVAQFAPALLDYLLNTIGEGESHMEDMAIQTASFAEAFYITVGYF